MDIKYPNWLPKTFGSPQNPDEMNHVVNVLHNHAEVLTDHQKQISLLEDGISPISIKPTTTQSELSALDNNKVYRLEGAGTYNALDINLVPGQANKIVPDGWDVKVAKIDGVWGLHNAVKMPTLSPTGVVEEGNAEAVSGGEVYDYLSDYAKTEETLDKLIKGWVISEAMAISNPTYSADGNISGAVITWGDGDVGSMSNVIVGQYGITSIRYNRSNGDYATMNIVYDNKGEFQSQEVIITKI